MLTTEVLTTVGALEALRPEWEALLEKSATNEPTLSPAWALAWWDVFGASEERALRVVIFRQAGKLVGIAPFLTRPARSAVWLPVRRLELLPSGEDQADEICSDFIGILAQRGAERLVAEAVADVLQDRRLGPWDELLMPAMNGDSVMPLFLGEVLRAHGFETRVEIVDGAPYVPLPATWDAYLEALPSSSRYLLRRSLRDFEAWAKGPGTLRRASTPEELERGKRLLQELHGERWAADGESGVFASERFRGFHDRLMNTLLPQGKLDLSWLEVDGQAVAASYNIVWNGNVYFYQGGRKPDLPAKIRPGLVMHALAIKGAIAAGRREYHFLAGLSRYKMQLALAVRPLCQVRAWPASIVQVGRSLSTVVLEQGRALLRRRRHDRDGTDLGPESGEAE